jgi:anti-sigma factor (TIGR02949 family)
MWCANVEWSEINCSEVLNLLERYLDHEVPQEARDPIERHLEECQHCLDRKDFRARLTVIVRTKCQRQELPAGLEARIRSVLARPD